MSTLALNKLLEYILSLSLSNSNKGWLAEKIIMSKTEETFQEMVFSISNQSSVENIFTRPNDETTYLVEDYNVIRSLHYNHASALGKSSWNGACATVHEMKVMGYGTDEQDPRVDLFFYTGMDYVSETECSYRKVWWCTIEEISV